MQIDFAQLLATAGTCTDDAVSKKAMDEAKKIFTTTNENIKNLETQLNTTVRTCETQLRHIIKKLKASHHRMFTEVTMKIAELKARGQATNLTGLNALFRQKSSLAIEIAKIEQRTQERNKCKEERKKLRDKLVSARNEMTKLRKAQIKGINSNLSTTIKDYCHFSNYFRINHIKLECTIIFI